MSLQEVAPPSFWWKVIWRVRSRRHDHYEAVIYGPSGMSEEEIFRRAKARGKPYLVSCNLVTVQEVAPPSFWWKVIWRVRSRRHDHYEALIYGPSGMSEEEIFRRAKARGKPYLASCTLAPIHQCSICGTEGPWTPDWSWYGSYAEIDDDKPVKKFCSSGCRNKFDAMQENKGKD